MDFETKSRINGCKKQITSFSFYFAGHLDQKLYDITDSLSKTLQKKKMSAVSGRNLVDLTVKTLQGMRNDRDFFSFHETVKKAASKVDGIEEPTVPRKRKRPNYSILHYVSGHERTSSEAYYPENAADYFKPIYFEATDVFVNSIKDKFQQPGCKIFTNIEQLLLKAINKESYEPELKALAEKYKGDFDLSTMSTELDLLSTICSDPSPVNFEDIVKRYSPFRKRSVI